MTANYSDPHVGLVVEGKGDVIAVPLLLRNYLHENGEYRDLLGKPVNCNGRDKAVKKLEGFVATAANRPGATGVLVILDGEGDPVCQLGPELFERASTATPKPVAVCLIDSKFESWIVASAESMELPTLTYEPHREPVACIREAIAPKKYVKPVWQPRLAQRIEITRAVGRSSSLARTLAKLSSFVRSC